MENEKDWKITFLDTSVSREQLQDGHLTASIYSKPTHTEQHLACDPHHPQSVKQVTVFTKALWLGEVSHHAILSSLQGIRLSNPLNKFCWGSVSQLFAVCWPTVSHLLALSPLTVGLSLANSWLLADRWQTVFIPFQTQVLANSKPTIGEQSANCWQSVGDPGLSYIRWLCNFLLCKWYTYILN